MHPDCDDNHKMDSDIKKMFGGQFFISCHCDYSWMAVEQVKHPIDIY
jgi:hypothetical protein